MEILGTCSLGCKYRGSVAVIQVHFYLDLKELKISLNILCTIVGTHAKLHMPQPSKQRGRSGGKSILDNIWEDSE